MAARLVLVAAGVLVVTLGAGWLVLRRVLGEHVRLFDGVLQSFDAFEQRFWRGSTPDAAPDPEIEGLGFRTRDLRALLDASEDRYRALRGDPGP